MDSNKPVVLCLSALLLWSLIRCVLLSMQVEVDGKELVVMYLSAVLLCFILRYVLLSLQVEVDGKELILPELEGVVVLNISSWGGGCKPWTSGDGDHFLPPR